MSFDPGKPVEILYGAQWIDAEIVYHDTSDDTYLVVYRCRDSARTLWYSPTNPAIRNKKVVKYVPFDSETLVPVIGKVARDKTGKRLRMVIGSDDVDGVTIHVGFRRLSPENFLNEWEFIDGSPCGVLKDG